MLRRGSDERVVPEQPERERDPSPPAISNVGYPTNPFAYGEGRGYTHPPNLQSYASMDSSRDYPGYGNVPPAPAPLRRSSRDYYGSGPAPLYGSGLPPPPPPPRADSDDSDVSGHYHRSYARRSGPPPRVEIRRGERERRRSLSPRGGGGRSFDDSDDIDLDRRAATRRRAAVTSRTPRRYSFESGSEESFDEYDNFISSKAFEFTPSRSSSASGSPRIGGPLEAGGSDGENSGTAGVPVAEVKVAQPPPAAPDGRPSSVLEVYESKYTGDSLSDGSHSAKLTVLHDPKKLRRPLFRWLHVQQDIMDFQDLSNEAMRLPELSDSDRNGLARLLAEVKRTRVKTKHTAEGSSVRYMDTCHVQLQLPDDSTKGQTMATSRRRFATFVCLPYFSLGKYAGLSTAAKNPNLYPNQTLLQAQYSRINRERDMQQVVCQMGSAKPGFCFHINQIWCIVIDNSYLITCAELDEASIRGDLITVVNEPLRKGPGSDGQARILVSYGASILWAFPINECETWFSFLTHFHDFWPQSVRIMHHDRVLTEQDWPRILNLARYSASSITLRLKMAAPPQPPTRGKFQPLAKLIPQSPAGKTGSPKPGLKPPKGKEPVKPKSDPGKGGEEVTVDKACTSFHVFTWKLGQETVRVGAATVNPTAEAPDAALDKELKEIDEYLSKETSYADRKAYQACKGSTRRSVFTYLEEQGAKVEGVRSVNRKREFDNSTDILNAADVVFQFFMPSGKEAEVVKKYWGAVAKLVELSPPFDRLPQEEAAADSRDSRDTNTRRYRIDDEPSNRNVPEIRKCLRILSQPIQYFTTMFGLANAAERARVVVPNQFTLAWLHILMALVHSTTDLHMWRDHFTFAEDKIREGMLDVINGFSTVNLLDKAMILPMDIVSMIGLTLFKDLTGAHPNITETYSEYLHALESDITTKPSDRYTQHRINLLKQELVIIRRVIDQEIMACSAMLPSIVRGDSWDLAAIRTKRPFDGGITRPYYGSAPPKPPPITTRIVERRGDNMRERGSGGYGVVETRRTPRRQQQNYDDSDDSSDTVVGGGYGGGYGGGFGGGGGGFGDFTTTTVADTQEYWKLPSTWRGGFRALLALDVVRVLQRRAGELDEFRIQAGILEEDSMNKVDLTKDRQEMAVYAFTIVTVIFLPLSAVASIFGMNTSDVRDMELGMWAYWASAVPVTIAVIVIGLWWMGELGNAFSWLGLRKKDPSSSGLISGPPSATYALIPPYTSGDNRAAAAAAGAYSMPPPPLPIQGRIFTDQQTLVPPGHLGPSPLLPNTTNPFAPTGYVDVSRVSAAPWTKNPVSFMHGSRRRRGYV